MYRLLFIIGLFISIYGYSKPVNPNYVRVTLNVIDTIVSSTGYTLTLKGDTIVLIPTGTLIPGNFDSLFVSGLQNEWIKNSDSILTDTVPFALETGSVTGINDTIYKYEIDTGLIRRTELSDTATNIRSDLSSEISDTANAIRNDFPEPIPKDSSFSLIEFDSARGWKTDTMYFNEQVQFNGGVLGETNTESFSVSKTINFNTQYDVEYTITNNTTITIAKIPNGINPKLSLLQDVTGSHIVTISGATAAPNTETIQTAANSVTLLQFEESFGVVYYFVTKLKE